MDHTDQGPSWGSHHERIMGMRLVTAPSDTGASPSLQVAAFQGCRLTSSMILMSMHHYCTWYQVPTSKVADHSSTSLQRSRPPAATGCHRRAKLLSRTSGYLAGRTQLTAYIPLLARYLLVAAANTFECLTCNNLRSTCRLQCSSRFCASARWLAAHQQQWGSPAVLLLVAMLLRAAPIRTACMLVTATLDKSTFAIGMTRINCCQHVHMAVCLR